MFVARVALAAVSIAPDSTSLPPGSTRSFVGGGAGAGAYVYSLATAASGGHIDPVTGVYVAGRTGNVVDVVRVSNNGSSATANVTVTAGVSVTAGSNTVLALGTTIVTAAGGAGAPFTYSVDPVNGATIDAAGLYTAGAMAPATDVVLATDALGNVASIEIGVGSGLAIAPATPSVSPRQHVTFSAAGGSGGGYAWTAVTLGSGGSVAVDGAYTAGALGPSTDRIRVTDSLGNEREVSIFVGPGLAIVQNAPNTTPRGQIAFSTNGGHGGVTWTVLAPSGGSIAAATGAYTAGALGSTQDAITATDDLGNSASVTVSVGPGISIGGARGVAPRESLVLVPSGGAGSDYTLVLDANPSGGAVVGSTYTAGAVGNQSDVVRATDALGNTAVVSIAVGPGVSIQPANPSSPPNGAVAFSAMGGKGSFTWSIADAESGVPTIDALTGAYLAGAIGNKVDTISVQDALGNVATVGVSIGGGLVIAPAATTLAPGASVAFVVSGGSGVGYVWSAVDLPSMGAISAAGLYTAGRTGLVEDRLRVTDSLGNKRLVTITVTAAISAGAAPSAVAPRGITTLTASGGSGSGFSWAFVSNASQGSLSNSGAYRAGVGGNVSDVVRVTDSLGNRANVSIAVSAPLLLAPNQASAPPNGEVTFTATAGAQPYRYSLQINASGGNVVESTGHYRAGAHANVQDVLAVTDANGVLASAIVQVGTGVVATPSVAIVAPNGSLAFAASGGSGSGFVWAMITNASMGSISRDTGIYLAGPNADVVDVIRVTDGILNSADVSIAVGAALLLTPLAPRVAPREPVAFAASGGSGEFQFSIVTNASGGSIDAATGAYVAGATADVVDRVQVVDRVGNAAIVEVSVGAGVSIVPTSLTLASKATVTFSVRGGSGAGYAWSLDQSESGASLDASSGAYVAGSVGGTDLVRVQDSLGNAAIATVTVTSLSAPAPDADAGSGTPADGGVSAFPPIGDSGCSCHASSSAPAASALSAMSSLLLAFACSLLLRKRRAP